jgi:hypothetical protein
VVTIEAATSDDRLCNARDVGGLSAADGAVVRRGVLFRADAPLPGDLPPGLSPWPPATVIDLRSPGEAADPDHPLAGEQTTVFSIPLLADADPTKVAALAATESGGLSGLYRTMLTGAIDALVRIIELAATAPAPVLIHCAAGKDRTGVSIALILALAGVPREDIVADYVLTADNLMAGLPRLIRGRPAEERPHVMERMRSIPAHLMGAPAEAISSVLDELGDGPDSAAAWLAERGLSHESVAALRTRLLT